MKRLILIGLLFLGTVILWSTPKQMDISELNWLQGQWYSHSKDTSYNESWLITPQGILCGNAVMKNKEGKVLFREILRIDKIGDHIVYIAAVNRNKPVLFTLINNAPIDNKPAWVFENKEHDYPQRIIYIMNSTGSLIAKVEGIHNGKEEKEEFPLIKETGNNNQGTGIPKKENED